MPKRIFRKKSVPKAKVNRRRRLQPAYKKPNPPGLRKVAEDVLKEFTPELYYAMKNGGKKVGMTKARSNVQSRIEQSDNITTAKAVTIGKQRPIGFQEKVSRSLYPPLLFKRNYQFNAECTSGRKGWFTCEVNLNNNNDLLVDTTSYKSQMRTDTATAELPLSVNGNSDGARFYVDYLSEKLQMVNSSSNSLTGKVHLFAHKRDNDGLFGSTSTPINPVNLMMFYSTNSVPALVAGAGAEGTVGNGWSFQGTGTTGLNFNAIYNMPGCNINAAGVAAQTDLQLSPMSTHIADRVGFWFRKVSTAPFSLKPGQQFNSSFIFNDLPKIFREQQDYVHLAGISYSICVEFQAGIVGDSTATSGDGTISTGSGQLSVIRESKRILGLENTLKSKIVLQTANLGSILAAAQVIINPDTGVQLSGAVQDT